MHQLTLHYSTHYRLTGKKSHPSVADIPVSLKQVQYNKHDGEQKYFVWCLDRHWNALILKETFGHMESDIQTFTICPAWHRVGNLYFLYIRRQHFC